MIGIRNLRGFPLPRAVLAAGMLVLPLRSVGAQARYTLDSTRSQLTFEANSTTGHFIGRATDVSGWAKTADTLSFAHARGEVRVQVASVHTGIGLRDRHLRSDMKADRFREVVVTIDSARVSPMRESAHPAMLVGTISFRGITRALTATAGIRLAGDTMVVTGGIPMRFTDFAMKPPTRVLGLTRVRDEWEIGFSIRFVRVR